MNFLPKLMIQVAIEADRANSVADAIKAAAYTGQIGDGKIFIFPLEQTIRIRTGETGRDAL